VCARVVKVHRLRDQSGVQHGGVNVAVIVIVIVVVRVIVGGHTRRRHDGNEFD